jgi:hypothetical protein
MNKAAAMSSRTTLTKLMIVAPVESVGFDGFSSDCILNGGLSAQAENHIAASNDILDS